MTPVFSGNTYADNTEADLLVFGSIATSIDWNEPAGTRYRINVLGMMVDADGSLSITPGIVVQTDQGANIDVRGTLTATGVTFTWADGQNQWLGIQFSGAAAGGSLQDCTIEHAAGFTAGSGIIRIASSSPSLTGNTISNSTAQRGIHLNNASSTVTGNTISGMGEYGIYVTGDSSPTVTGNTITANTYGAYIYYSSSYAMTPVFNGNTYADNTEADLHVEGYIMATINWDEPAGTRYRITSTGMFVNENASLSITPGVIVQAEQGANIDARGTLSATGVTFSWADGQNQWSGIQFYNAGSSGSSLQDCTIEHATEYSSGSGIISIYSSSPSLTGNTISNSTAPRGIFMSSASPSVTGNTISGMDEYGIYVTGDSSPTVTGNTITANTYGAYIFYHAAYMMNPVFNNNTYADNTEADLHVGGYIRTTINWDEPAGTLYRITTSDIFVNDAASLSITPGIIVQAEQGARIDVRGTLSATGVTFTWADGQNQWEGIQFYNTGSSGSSLQDCTIKHAAGYSTGTGIIYIVSSSPTLTGNTINNSSAPRGISINNASPTVTGNTISGMGEYGVYVTGVTSAPVFRYNTVVNNDRGIGTSSNAAGIYQDNTIMLNTSYGFYNLNSAITVNAENNYWGHASGPYDPSDDTASGGLYNPGGQGDMVTDLVDYHPWGDVSFDNDLDTIPDAWEIILFGDLATADDTTDYDGDGFGDGVEIDAGSDPANSNSYPAETEIVVDLRNGYNQLSFPAETLYYGDLQTFIEALGGSAVIDKVLVFDQDTQKFVEAGFDGDGAFYGNNLTLPAGQGLPGLLIYAKQNDTIDFTSQYCHTWNLKPGTNLIGSGCIPDGLTASQLLNSPDLGPANISSIQRFNTDTGMFEALGFEADDTIAGDDFPLVPGEGYWVNMKQEVMDFRP